MGHYSVCLTKEKDFLKNIICSRRHFVLIVTYLCICVGGSAMKLLGSARGQRGGEWHGLVDEETGPCITINTTSCEEQDEDDHDGHDGHDG